MPRAYEPGERWVVEPEGTEGWPLIRNERSCICELSADTREQSIALLALIAESPLRDELLREIETRIAAEAEYLGAKDRALLARIRDTLGRTE